MAESPATCELFMATAVTDDEIVAAVNVFMRDSTMSMFQFARGHSFDPAAALKSYAWAKATVTNADTTNHLKRPAVRTAILLARPEKP